jgi:hypothetical protein
LKVARGQPGLKRSGRYEVLAPARVDSKYRSDTPPDAVLHANVLDALDGKRTVDAK